MKKVIEFLQSIRYTGVIQKTLLFVIGGLTFFCLHNIFHKETVQYQEEFMKLKYVNAKYEIVNSVQSYIDSVAPYNCIDALLLVNKCLEHNIDICFVMAQSHKESHFGTKGMARKTNSIFNVYAYDGADYDKIHQLGKFDDPNLSIEPYLELLDRRYLVGKTEYDLLDEYIDVDGNRYASDSCYESDLRDIYESIKTNTLIDIYSQQLKKYGLLLNH